MSNKPSLKKIIRHEYFFILILITINIIIGLFIVDDYGVTPDEPLSWEFGTQGFYMYSGKGEVINVDYSHGGGFLIPAKVGQLFFSFLFPKWVEPYTWHYVYFLFFQFSIIFIFLLAKKVVGTWGANFTALLYATQPLLWGHSFMNPKDTPFMALFLGAIILGVNFTDKLKTIDWGDTTFFDSIRLSIQENKKNNKLKTRLAISFTLIGLYLFFMFGTAIISHWIETIITMLYTADPASLPGKIFSALASNAEILPLEKYISKGIRFYQILVRRGNITVFPVLLIGSFSWLFPQAIKHILCTVKKIITTKQFYSAAAILGMCIAARTMGIVVVGMIGLYMILKLGRKSPLVIVFYLAAAGIVGFILWPHLWETPIKTFLVYVDNVFGFENWRLNILFEGEIYNKYNYPNYFIPKMFGLQFTEPTMFLFILGMVFAGIRTWQKKYDWVLIGLLAGWLFAPLVLAVLLHPVVYNNFRHFLFILPPIFIFAGVGADVIFQKINKHTWRILLIAILILPSLAAIIQLHPYEYIYYNSFAGGIKGAFREYELDYWLTGYKDAIEYVNEIAPPDAWVSVNGETALVSWFAREDINLESRPETVEITHLDYMIVSTNINHDQDFESYFPNMIEVHAVECKGVPLVKVYKFIPNDEYLEN